MKTAPLPTDFARYSDIEAAIRRLPVLSDESYRIPLLADLLAQIGLTIRETGGDGTAPPHFRPASAATIRNDLEELERRARDLAKKIEAGGSQTRARAQLARHIQGLNMPTIGALSKSPAIIVDDQPIRIDWAYFRQGFPTDLQAGGDITAAYLAILADLTGAALKAELEGTAAGRLPDNRARVVANLLAKNYSSLTGLDPTFATVAGKEGEGKVYGPFLDFVKEIFEALGIERAGLSNASRAARTIRGKGRKK